MKAEKMVDVTVNYKGEDKPGKVGFYKRFELELKDGQWVDTDREEIIFGYCLDGYVTHMSYGSSYIGTWEEFAVTSKHARTFHEFYFDAGGNGRPLYIKYKELCRALVELELLNKEAINYCERCKHSSLVHRNTDTGECSFILGHNKFSDDSCICAAFVES